MKNDNNYVKVHYTNPVVPVKHVTSYIKNNKTYNNVYFINPGKSLSIDFPEDTIEYYIQECGVNSEVYSAVQCNGNNTTTNSNGDVVTVETTVGETPVVVLDNQVNPEALKTLTIRKKLYDKDGTTEIHDDPTTFTFQLSLTSESEHNDLAQVNMRKYCVEDPNGKLCSWDADHQCFISTDYTYSQYTNTFTPLDDDIKDSLTFETSIYGKISNIPAWYKVKVPNVFNGTLFLVEETNIPLGYDLKSPGFECVLEDGLDTYYHNLNECEKGQVISTKSPSVDVSNKRGWGLQAKKVWSDKDFVSEHGTIYTAVYVGSSTTPLNGTVREITENNPTVTYFFDRLQTGAQFSDYGIYEVVLNSNPEFDANGLPTEASIIKLEDKDVTSVNGLSYEVTYTHGVPQPTASGADTEIRTDTITNTRSGGIVFTLYDKITKAPLANGVFVLKNGDTEIGTYTSDETGRITIMYDYLENVEYTLTQITAPKGYIGIPNVCSITVSSNNHVTVTGNDAEWQIVNLTPSDKLIAHIDLYNKPFTLKALKADDESKEPLEGAHFALYKSVQTSAGTLRKDYFPMISYEDLVTGSDGIVPQITEDLDPGTYYLTELSPPTGYTGLSADIVFNISVKGVLTVDNTARPANEETINGTTSYTLKLPTRKRPKKPH